VLRPETKARARALQILYAWELSGEPIEVAASGLARLAGTSPRIIDHAEALATGVLADLVR